MEEYMHIYICVKQVKETASKMWVVKEWPSSESLKGLVISGQSDPLLINQQCDTIPFILLKLLLSTETQQWL